MIANRGTLRTIQQEIHDALAAQSFFNDITLVMLDDGDVETLINRALAETQSKAGKTGPCVLIGHPDPGQAAFDIARGDSRAFYPAIRVRLLINEAVLMNRDATLGTGKPAMTVGEAIVATLQRARQSDQAPRYCNGPRKLQSEDSDLAEASVDYLVELTTEGWATALLPTATPYYP
jgi:hypothetical protein